MPTPPDSTFTDSRTGLSNRRHFEVLYDFAFHLANRGVSLSLVYVELDTFSTFRDRSGAEAADEALRTFGRMLAETTRTMDVAAHFEDGRFAAMLMDCNLHGSLVYADRIRDAGSAFSGETGLEVCAGVATYMPGMSAPSELLAVAEATLAVAIAAGGKRVGVPADLEDPGSTTAGTDEAAATPG